ncbi:MAG: BON domain-containing protein [Gammaproteobacteria bacterium]|nr:BON domain-containing protein [Gammaproteobacteria bacterium]
MNHHIIQQAVCTRLAMVLLALIALTQLAGCVVAAVGGAAVAGSAVHDRRSFGTVINDENIEISVTDALYSKPEIKRSDRIKVVSVNGIVLLAGEIDSEEKKQFAGEVAGRIEDVRKVVNELVVTDTIAGVGTRTSDSWLTTRVKTALFGVDIDGFDPTRVNVTTASGRVYLQGMVTVAEGEAAAQEASTVGGVKQVVKVFEYIEPASDAPQLEGELGRADEET